MSFLDVRGRRFFFRADKSIDAKELYGVQRVGMNQFLLTQTHGNCRKLNALKPRMTRSAQDIVERMLAEIAERQVYVKAKHARVQHLAKQSYQPAPLKTKPFQHQKKAITIGAAIPSLALFADPGTGKTLMSLGIAGCKFQAKKVRKILIACPLSVVDVWYDQAMEHADFSFTFTSLTKRSLDADLPDDDGPCHFVVVNYDFYWRKKTKKKLLAWEPDMVILDESHRAKSNKSKTSRFAHKLGDRCGHKLVLDGTPMERPTDIWSQFRFLDRRLLPEKFAEFVEEYVIKGGYMGLQTVGYKNQDQLARIIASTAYRVTLDEAVDLPQWTPSNRYCYLPLRLRKAYNQLDHNMETELLAGGVSTAHVLTKITKLHQMCGGWLKMPDGTIAHVGNHKLDLLEEVLKEFSGEKVVIFAKYIAEINAIQLLAKKLKREFYVITGKSKDRTEQRKAFQSSEGNGIMIAQVKAGGIGIDLFTSRVVINFSMPQSWTELFQALQRVRRIGQTGTRLCLVNLLVRMSIDEDILQANTAKEVLVNFLFKKRNRHAEDHQA